MRTHSQNLSFLAFLLLIVLFAACSSIGNPNFLTTAYSQQGYPHDVSLQLETSTKARSESSAQTLQKAAQLGQVGVVKRLLEDNVDINKRSAAGTTALMTAAWYGHKDIVQLLLDNGTEINLQTPLEKWTALMFAVERNQPDVLQVLLANGADINVQSKTGNTATPRVYIQSHLQSLCSG